MKPSIDKPSVLIRPIVPADKTDWGRLWGGYLAFYEKTLEPDITEETWRRIVDPAVTDMIGRGAELGGRLVGMLHAVIHPNTWARRPVCYLEDLYVDEALRGSGIGRALIEALAQEGRSRGWHRIYWRTASDNANAKLLYDRVARRSGWVTYEIDLQ
ncbi:MAG TPA: GNAT family N-acetyltransferase [Xanthobacteraceae bacterium]|jgi:GNAT superfamily N-acetyltransferase|nr:GNAT family N-acetyltransferase [Xanthobacteraceae bacterium]